MHLYYELLVCRNDLTTLTDIMNSHNVLDIFSIHHKIRLKSLIYIAVSLKMAARSTSSARQNLLHGAKSAGRYTYLIVPLVLNNVLSMVIVLIFFCYFVAFINEMLCFYRILFDMFLYKWELWWLSCFFFIFTHFCCTY